MSKLGLASQLKTFPDNEIKKGQYAMALKAVSRQAENIEWPKSSNHLPVLTWDECTFSFHRRRRRPRPS
jgi:stearoyl-CoA desaturase (delta-9 desaturase)